MRSLWLLVILHQVIGHQRIPIPDEAEPLEITMCNNRACECLVHETNILYIQGSNVSVDIFCNCDHLEEKIVHLLSPHPVPQYTILLQISRCDEVNVTPVTATQWTPPHSLVINDVGKLNIQEGAALDAYYLLIRNVGYIPELPARVLRIASFPDRPIGAFHLENSVIGEIKESSLVNVHINHIFQFSNVTITSIDELAINVSVIQSGGQFNVMKCKIEKIFSSGISAMAPSIVLQHNVITFIETHAFKIIAERFDLDSCSVPGIVKVSAFDVQTRVVAIVHNYFAHLEPGAFISVRPWDYYIHHGICKDCLFAFAYNRFKLTDHYSIHANWTLDRNDMVAENIFDDCSCTNIKWIWLAKYGQHNAQVLFYSALLDPKNKNLCESEACQSLPISEVLENVVNMNNQSDSFCDDNSTFTCTQFLNYYGNLAVKSYEISIFSVILFLVLFILLS